MPRGIPKKTSKDEIINANLRRMLSKLKTRVAESEEVWLDMFQDILPLVVGDDLGEFTTMAWWEGKVKLAGLIADSVLAEYERRWGGPERRGTGV